MIKLARSIMLLAKVRCSSILDTSLKEDKPPSMKLLHRQSQGYFKNDNFFFEPSTYLSFYGASFKEGRDVCNFRYYGNLLLSAMLEELNKAFTEVELKNFSLLECADHISGDHIKMDILALKFYEKRAELLN